MTIINYELNEVKQFHVLEIGVGTQLMWSN